MANDPIITVAGLGKRYVLEGASESFCPRNMVARAARKLLGGSPVSRQEKEMWALKDVSFSVKSGERVGIIGRNGAGKSTLLKILSRVVSPTAGEARIRGRMTSLLEVGTGFNDHLTGRENVYLNAALHGLNRSAIDERFEEIVSFAEVARFIDTPVKKYSSGMKMRLAFSVAAHLSPDILVMDEVLAVGDMAFQQKCLERVEGMTSGGRTLILVSHSMDAVSRYCDRCIWLDRGQVLMDSGAQEVISAYTSSVLNVRSRYEAPIPNKFLEERQASKPISGVGVGAAEGYAREEVRLTSASVVDTALNNRELFTVDEQIGIKLAYDVAVSGTYMPAIHVYSPQGTLAFVSAPVEQEAQEFRFFGPQTVEMVAWLPPHLLNIGIYRISIVIFNPFEAPFLRYIEAEQLLAFHTTESATGSAKAGLPRSFPGPVRPYIKWVSSEVFAKDGPSKLKIDQSQE